MLKFDTICLYCGKNIIGYNYETREEISLNSFKNIRRARVVDSDIQYVQSNSKSPVRLFHYSCMMKNIEQKQWWR